MNSSLPVTIAMPPIRFVLDAIYRHRRDHDGKSPSAIVVSPPVWDSIKQDLLATCVLYQVNALEPGELKIDGVPLKVARWCRTPFMITARPGVSEHL